MLAALIHVEKRESIIDGIVLDCVWPLLRKLHTNFVYLAIEVILCGMCHRTHFQFTHQKVNFSTNLRSAIEFGAFTPVALVWPPSLALLSNCLASVYRLYNHG